MNHDNIINSVRQWLETVVIGLNLCPFAKRELVNNRINFIVSDANNELDLLDDLKQALKQLNDDHSIETSLLIHPNVLQNFTDYNQFLDYADDVLYDMKLDGVYQIASFHPDYQFADTHIDDVENYTNRSPYPLLHLLREESLEKAVANYPHPEQIPERNIALFREMGVDKIRALLNAK